MRDTLYAMGNAGVDLERQLADALVDMSPEAIAARIRRVVELNRL